MNILLNNYCNLNCEYCFANEVLEEDRKNMTKEDFIWLLNFLKRSNTPNIRLIGGEPTLHPQFIELILEATSKKYTNHVHVFSNGTFNANIGYFLMCLASKVGVSILLNYNHPDIIGEKFNDIILSHLSEFQKSNVYITLGINFYKPNQDYHYLINAAKSYGIRDIRWSVVVPNSDEKKQNPKEYFNQFIPLLKGFLRDCALLDLDPHVDCNNIPLCLFDDDTLRWLCLVAGENNTRVSTCNPVIDVTPNMEALRCFIMNKYRVPIKDFYNLEELNKHFREKVDSKFDGVKLFDACADCASFQVKNRSCACLTYKEGVV